MNLISHWKLFHKTWTLYLPVISIRAFRIAQWHKVTFGLWLHVSSDEVTRAVPSDKEHAREYMYGRLDDHEIRLFVLEPGKRDDPICGRMKLSRIRLVHREYYREYDALSYVWGSPIEEGTIRVDGLPLKVTRSLHSALKNLRSQTSPRTIWVDAICINQFDITEKNTQIQLMPSIYSQATNVAIWLGEPTEYSSVGIEVLDYFANARAPSAQASWLSLPPLLVLRGLTDIMAREWFRRTWVVQEVVLSSAATVICGSRSFKWAPHECIAVQRFMRMIKFAELSAQWEQRGLGNIDMRPLLELLDLQVGQQLDRSHGGTIRSAADPLEIMYDLRHRRATDARDKLFALVGMLKDSYGGQDLQVDYNWSLEQTYEHLLSVITF